MNLRSDCERAPEKHEVGTQYRDGLAWRIKNAIVHPQCWRRSGAERCGVVWALGQASRELLALIQAAQLISRSCGAFPTTQPFVVAAQL